MSVVHVLDAAGGGLVGRYPLSDRDVDRLKAGNRLRVEFRVRPHFTHRALGDAPEVGVFDLFVRDGAVHTNAPDELRRCLQLRNGDLGAPPSLADIEAGRLVLKRNNGD